MRENIGMFKAKDINTSEWREGYYWSNEVGNHFIRVVRDKENNFINATDYEVDPETLSQYTGLKDKRGKMIFENDILKLNIQLQGYSSGELDDDSSFFGHIIGYVRFIPCKGFCLQSALIYDEIIEEKRKHNTKKNIVSYRSEIIGNKFDNPELLEKGGAS